MNEEMDVNRYINFLLTRRSIRKFKDKNIDDDTILKILDIARYAPSAHNSQPWEFIIIRDRDILKELSKIHYGAKPLSRAPLAIVVVCNPSESPTSYLVDCANATMYILLAAHALGLGCVWIQTLRDIDKIRKILNIPRNLIPVSIIAVGYPDERPEAPWRKPLNQLIHYDKYSGRR